MRGLGNCAEKNKSCGWGKKTWGKKKIRAFDNCGGKKMLVEIRHG